jgi:glycerate kinase
VRRSFLVAPDSFKGTLKAGEVAEAIGSGLRRGGADADLCPLADGGEGTMEVLVRALGGDYRAAVVHDPLGREIEASFALLADGQTAVVEVAQASGLSLLNEVERDPLRATTAGVGELLVAAVRSGASRLLVAAGGSATSEGGMGAIEAISSAGGLRGAELEVLCDVDTPFEAAAEVFGPQKGADRAAVSELTARLHRLAARLPRDPRGIPRTGCAGGLSGGLWAACGARLRSGAEYVLEAVDFDERMARTRAVITGEGRFDSQSLVGKLVEVVARRCAASQTPLHVIAGRVDLGSRDMHELRIASVHEAGRAASIAKAAQELALARYR